MRHVKEMQDPELKQIKKKYDSAIVEFIRSNSQQILNELAEDESYQSCETDIPKIPSFDRYLEDLEAKIQKDVAKIGFFNGTAARLANEYRTIFYYSSLPSLSEHYN